jgi:cbb3-type cytochrome c oxidase subunit III
MKKLSALTLMACLAGQSLWVHADTGAEANARFQTCSACHGEAAQGNAALGAPALAGQGVAYLQRQLQNFKSGVRGADARDVQGAQMRPMASALDDADIPLMANYLASLPRPTPTPQAGDLKNGNNYYQSKCGACHGGQAEGNPGLNAPGLAWLDAAYLKHQFKNFQLGVRGTHPGDTYGRQMKMMSTSLPTDKDVDDVIAFIQSLAKAL